MRLFSSTKIIQIDFQKFFLLNEAVHTHRRFHFPALVLPSPGSPHAPVVKRFLLHVSGCFRKIRSLTPSSYLAPLSYGIPSAFGAWEFLDVNARIIMDAINGIML